MKDDVCRSINDLIESDFAHDWVVLYNLVKSNTNLSMEIHDLMRDRLNNNNLNYFHYMKPYLKVQKMCHVMTMFNVDEQENLRALYEAKDYELVCSLVRSRYSLIDTKYHLWQWLKADGKYSTNANRKDKFFYYLHDFEKYGLLRIIKSHRFFKRFYKSSNYD